MKIYNDWMCDLPSQFQDKNNIEILIKAFSRQLEDVLNVFKELDIKTYIDVAEGKNLYMAGSIVAM